jgi:hypothetical protein
VSFGDCDGLSDHRAGSLALGGNGAFERTGSSFVLKQGELFANGFRYMSWSIDVPVLLTQLLIVGGITGVAFRSKWIQFLIAQKLSAETGYKPSIETMYWEDPVESAWHRRGESDLLDRCGGVTRRSSVVQQVPP